MNSAIVYKIVYNIDTERIETMYKTKKYILTNTVTLKVTVNRLLMNMIFCAEVSSSGNSERSASY